MTSYWCLWIKSQSDWSFCKVRKTLIRSSSFLAPPHPPSFYHDRKLPFKRVLWGDNFFWGVEKIDTRVKNLPCWQFQTSDSLRATIVIARACTEVDARFADELSNMKYVGAIVNSVLSLHPHFDRGQNIPPSQIQQTKKKLRARNVDQWSCINHICINYWRNTLWRLSFLPILTARRCLNWFLNKGQEEDEEADGFSDFLLFMPQRQDSKHRCT